MKKLIFLTIGMFAIASMTFAQMDTINLGTGGHYTGQHVVSSDAKGDNIKVALTKVNGNFEQIFERGNTYAAYSSGTNYTLTASTALADFATTDPTITIAKAGKYLIFTKANYKLVGATFAGNQTITTKLRRTNNTAADLTSASDVITLPIVTTTTNHAGSSAFPVIVYTAAAGDIIQVWTALSATPSAGTVDCTNASIVAVKISE